MKIGRGCENPSLAPVLTPRQTLERGSPRTRRLNVNLANSMVRFLVCGPIPVCAVSDLI